ncbi:3-hydroxyacyl-CoA dehydrogenase family protein [Marinobacterium jannaschii]|uniref:3-hydroxyacyl-CoA dehydrogenase family protein n=1 Tax=Marinobacterium jannaschii TaxID=64970 RepID=UPI000480376C|nr:3-hydroxyacyl-CoA dehydrogenase NAD-binding domain-containing protein [Marinobacterium jannaschii]
MHNFSSIAVIGAGQMGCGIAQSIAAAGIEVKLSDATPDLAQQGLARIHLRLLGQVEKHKLQPEEADHIVANITPVPSLESIHNCDLVIEAASEDLALKLELFRKLDQYAKPEALLASNTSSLSITTIAAATRRPQNVIGMHFFNPVPVMELVEVIRGLATSDITQTRILRLSEALGKKPVCSVDKAGFVVNRILLPMLNEACFLLDEGVASATDIDSAMQLGCAHPMGPLALADFIGLDTCLAIMEVLQKELGEVKYRPAPLLRRYVAAGWLGKKTGRGFFDYND